MNQPFNINEVVRVRVTLVGLKLLEKRDQEFNDRFPKLRMRADSARKVFAEQQDNGGWSRWQLWHLMETFGPEVSLGKLAPFETVIELCLP